MSEPVVDRELALEHGLSDVEWQRVLEILGRTNTSSIASLLSNATRRENRRV